jgi:tripartite-type tricarboxylate transporter receptor subunit TctC
MKRMSKLYLTVMAVALVLVLVAPAPGICQWPTKQLNIVVPFGSGGTTDRIARAMGPFLAKELGVPVVLINRKGGGGITGTKVHLKNDPADGSFIVYTLEPYLSGAVFKGAFKLDDFDYLGLNYYSPQGLWVHASSEFTSAKKLLHAMKKNPGKITMSVIPNSWSRVGNSLLKERLNGFAKEIPYQSGGKQRMGVIKKEVVCTITEVYGTLASASEDMRCLAVFGDKRLPELPEVPTINEVLGEMGAKPMPALSNFRFFMVKKGFKENHPDLFEVLEKAMAKASLNPEYQKIMNNLKLKIQWKGSAETTEAVKKAHETLLPFAVFWQGKKK